MECICGQASGSDEDHAHNPSPVVISSYALQLELDCIGRPIPLYVLCVCVCVRPVYGGLNMEMKRQLHYYSWLFFSTYGLYQYTDIYVFFQMEEEAIMT